jgi:hypothetical protein
LIKTRQVLREFDVVLVHVNISKNILYFNNNNNSIRFYLRANLTAQRPITKRARAEKKTKKKTHTYKQKAKARKF